MWRNFVSPALYAGLCTITLVCTLTLSSAQVMESGNYQIQSDSINFGGGFSSSSNYTLESTAGEVGTGLSDSANFGLGAGYQQMQSVYIALSGVTNVSLSPSIPGVTGGTSNGSTTVTVITDSPSGYLLTIAAENSPAMNKGGDSIADYVPAGVPDFDFTTDATDAHFGYTPEGEDVVDRFLDDGDSCDDGSANAPLKCWDGLSLTEESIASSMLPNHPDGATTTVHFRVGVGSSVVQAPGTYIATTTITALPL